MNDVADRDTPPEVAPEFTLVGIGTNAKRAVDLGMENRSEIAAMRAELHLAIRPISRTPGERYAVLAMGIASTVIALAVVVLVTVFVARPAAASVDTGSEHAHR